MRRALRLSFAPLLLAFLAHPAAPAAVDIDPERVGWSELQFTASKLLMSARASVTARVVPANATTVAFASPPSGRPVQAGSEVLELVYRTSGFGRASVTTLWADPSSGATLQQLQQDQQGRLRERTYRYTDIGAWHYTRRPATAREEQLPPSQWTDLSEGMRPFPDAARGQSVSAPTVLLWLAAAGNLSRSGDRIEVLTFSRRQLHRVRMDVVGKRAVEVNLTEKGSTAGTRRRQERIDAIVLRIRGTPLDVPDDEEPFELLGLRGDLELLLDPATRAPLQLQGRVKVMGRVTVQLREMSLR